MSNCQADIDAARRELLRQLYRAMYGNDPPAMPISPAELWTRLLHQIALCGHDRWGRIVYTGWAPNPTTEERLSATERNIDAEMERVRDIEARLEAGYEWAVNEHGKLSPTAVVPIFEDIRFLLDRVKELGERIERYREALEEIALLGYPSPQEWMHQAYTIARAALSDTPAHLPDTEAGEA